MKQLKTNSDYAELFKGLMDLAGVNPHEFELFQKGMRNYPRPGDYQLKNKEFQTEPRWGEEWGIYFTPNKYINIDAMNGWKKDLTAEEVRVWAKMNGYRIPSEAELKAKTNDDVLVIDQNLKGLDFSLAKCCQPIYGDDVFGFVTVNGGIKIHRQDCPNAQELRKRFGYRIVKARWAGKRGSQYPITLKVIGNDDLGIVNNITSIISKEEKISLRSISIDSHDGLFSGTLTVMLDDTSKLQLLEKKLKTIKGVKQVSRN